MPEVLVRLRHRGHPMAREDEAGVTGESRLVWVQSTPAPRKGEGWAQGGMEAGSSSSYSTSWGGPSPPATLDSGPALFLQQAA